MARARVLLLCLVAFGCAERAPAAPSFRDLDAAPPDAPYVPRTGSGGTSGGGGGGGSSATDCQARLLVIFDRSVSMAEPWQNTAGESAPRWRVAADALDAALAPLADRLEVGAILFPSGGVDVHDCRAVDPIEAQLPYRDGASFLAAWRARWAGEDLGYGTPIDGAFWRADQALPSDGRVTAVVLLTDGEPTCRGETAAEAYAATWEARGISTFVIGLPGSRTDAVSVLNGIAREGGTGSYLPVDDPAALAAGLERIAGTVVEQACM